jgi:putative ABC transport system ATP-binding protein
MPVEHGGTAVAALPVDEAEFAAATAPGVPAVVAWDLGLSYREGPGWRPALEGVRLGLRGPGCVGIAGPSGSGKSSLLHVLAGLKRPTAGRVVALGADLGRLPPGERCALRRRRFGFVFQQPFLIHYLTALENVLVGSPRFDAAARVRARQLLHRLGLAGLERRLPHQLSGGQRQRVAAARALMNAPAVLFADEPTAALDRQTGTELMDLLGAYRRERGALLVIVSHDEAVLEAADAVVRLRHGRVERIDRGAPAGGACAEAGN